MKSHRKDQINVFAITWLSYMVLYLTRKNFSVVKSVLHQQAGLSIAMLGTIDTCFLAIYAFGQFFSGWLADKTGAKKIIAMGLIGSGIFSLGFSLVDDVVLFALFFALNGLFQSTGWSTNIKAVEPWFAKNDRGKILSWWGTNQQVGGLFGTILAAFLLAHFGWRSAFYVPAIIVAITGVFVFFFLVESPNKKTNTASNLSRERLNYRKMLKNPILWSISLAYFGLKLIRYSLLFWLPFYLYNTLGISIGEAGFLSISFEIGGIIGSIAVGWISDRFFFNSRAKLIFPMFMLLAISLYFYRYCAASSIAINCVMIALVGAFVYGPDVLISGACAQDIGGEKMTGSVAGFINGVGSVGAMLQGVITAYVSTVWGWPSLFYLFVIIAVISGFMLLPFVWLTHHTQKVPLALKA